MEISIRCRSSLVKIATILSSLSAEKSLPLSISIIKGVSNSSLDILSEANAGMHKLITIAQKRMRDKNLLFTTAFAASPSFRTQTLTALVEMFDDHSEIRFSGTTNGAETHKMSILWMPDGYQIGLEEFDESRMIIRADGENGENLDVAATAISKNRSYSFDTEGAIEESAMVQNNEAGVYQMKTEKGDKITVLWTDMEKGWIVKVTGYNISKEDMLRISESVEIR